MRIGRITKLLTFSGFILAAAWAQPYRPVLISGHSMEPTYKGGEMVVLNKSDRDFQKGEIVVIQHEGTTLIKRVAKIPGERYREYQLRGRWLPIETEKELAWAKAHQTPLRWAAIPQGHLYVLGDNVANSTDSRQLGPISLDEVEGKVTNPRPYSRTAVNSYQYRFFGAVTE